MDWYKFPDPYVLRGNPALALRREYCRLGHRGEKLFVQSGPDCFHQITTSLDHDFRIDMKWPAVMRPADLCDARRPGLTQSCLFWQDSESCAIMMFAIAAPLNMKRPVIGSWKEEHHAAQHAQDLREADTCEAGCFAAGGGWFARCPLTLFE